MIPQIPRNGADMLRANCQEIKEFCGRKLIRLVIPNSLKVSYVFTSKGSKGFGPIPDSSFIAPGLNRDGCWMLGEKSYYNWSNKWKKLFPNLPMPI